LPRGRFSSVAAWKDSEDQVNDSTSAPHDRRTEDDALAGARREPEDLAFGDAGDNAWSIERGRSPVIATAIHDGHVLRPEVGSSMGLADAARLREEDPFTEFVTRDVASRIIVHRSRFEVDLNRPRDGAVYIDPEQAWGLDVWKRPPDPDLVAASLAIHDAYYDALEVELQRLERDHGRFVLLDMHSYNHRRDGAAEPPTDPERAPEINIGTHSMDRKRWAHVVDPFIERMRAFDFRGRHLDVRENVAFEGRGEQTRFVHEHFPETGCAIAIEFKKIFMDEWTGEPDRKTLEALRAMIRSTLPLLEDVLRQA
jgi:hypothetical protein